MSVEFDEDVVSSSYQQKAQYEQAQQTGNFDNSDLPRLVRLVLKFHLAKDEPGANKVLVIVTLCSFLLTAFIIFKYIL